MFGLCLFEIFPTSSILSHEVISVPLQLSEKTALLGVPYAGLNVKACFISATKNIAMIALQILLMANRGVTSVASGPAPRPGAVCCGRVGRTNRAAPRGGGGGCTAPAKQTAAE